MKAKTDGTLEEKAEHVRSLLMWEAGAAQAVIDTVDAMVEQVAREYDRAKDDPVCAMCGEGDDEEKVQHITHASTGARHHYHPGCLLDLAIGVARDDTLLPCPLCGCPAQIKSSPRSDLPDQLVWCTSCTNQEGDECRLASGGVWYAHKADAIRQWNRRPTSPLRYRTTTTFLDSIPPDPGLATK